MTIALQLGYPDNRLMTVGTIPVALAALDAAISSAVIDSVAVKVGDLSLDYTNHLEQLKREGSRQLQLLSAQMDVPVYFDRYMSEFPGYDLSELEPWLERRKLSVPTLVFKTVNELVFAYPKLVRQPGNLSSFSVVSAY